MKMTYQVTGYQLLNLDGTRDTVRLSRPEVTNDIEEYRILLSDTHGGKRVNLTYTEIPISEEL